MSTLGWDHNESMRPADTTPEAWEVLKTLQRNMPPAEKMQLAFEWSEIIRQFAEAGLQAKYPHATEREIFLRYARQTLGEELFRKVYGTELPDDAAACHNI
jgi:gentisate 1,2-dioxygenase